MIIEAAALGDKIKTLSKESEIQMAVWIALLPTLDRRRIAEARLQYEETMAMWMDAHERLTEQLLELVNRKAK